MTGEGDRGALSAGHAAPVGPRLARLLMLADRPVGTVVLVLMALLEATVFPGPTEAMLVALTLSRPKGACWFAAIATAASAVEVSSDTASMPRSSRNRASGARGVRVHRAHRCGPPRLPQQHVAGARDLGLHADPVHATTR